MAQLIPFKLMAIELVKIGRKIELQVESAHISRLASCIILCVIFKPVNNLCDKV